MFFLVCMPILAAYGIVAVVIYEREVRTWKR